MTEVRELMSTARTYLSEGNLSHAFDLAQEATQLLQQVQQSTAISTACYFALRHFFNAMRAPSFRFRIDMQITGPIHKESAMSMDLIANILIEAGMHPSHRF